MKNTKTLILSFLLVSSFFGCSMFNHVGRATVSNDNWSGAGYCSKVTCLSGKVCNPASGDCILISQNLCQNVTCPDPNLPVCDMITGQCVSIGNPTIPVVDLCQNVSCPNGTYCDGGQCVSHCSNPACSGVQICKQQQGCSWACVATETIYKLRDPGLAGGSVFYDRGSYTTGLPHNWRYLEVAPIDLSAATTWGCLGTSITGADGTTVGTGAQNTLDILAGCSTAGIAAKLCDDLEISGTTCYDWFLPSKDELNKMYVNLKSGTDELGQTYTPVGGFASVLYYWSSSEVNGDSAGIQNFDNPTTQTYAPKSYPNFKARCIRAF